MPSPIHLSERSNLALHASVEHVLEVLLEEVRAADVKPARCVCVLITTMPNGKWSFRSKIAGVTYPEHIAILFSALQEVLRDWEAGP